MIRLTALALLIALATPAFANFTVDFQRKYREAEAERTFNADKFEAAREAFLELAADSPTPEEATKWRARAAIALGSQEGKFDQGLAEALAIEVRPYSVYAQITLLAASNEHSRLIETFGDEPIMEWQAEFTVPSGRRLSQEDVRAYALVDRAAAFSALGEGKRAEQDLALAAGLINDATFKVTTLSDLATVRQNQLNDPEGAFAANRAIVEVGGGGATFYRGLLNAVAWLRDNGRYEEALGILAELESRQREPFEAWRGVTWPAAMLSSMAATYAAMGETGKAIETYQRVLLINDLPDRLRTPAEEKIATLMQE